MTNYQKRNFIHLLYVRSKLANHFFEKHKNFNSEISRAIEQIEGNQVRRRRHWIYKLPPMIIMTNSLGEEEEEEEKEEEEGKSLIK